MARRVTEQVAASRCIDSGDGEESDAELKNKGSESDADYEVQSDCELSTDSEIDTLDASFVDKEDIDGSSNIGDVARHIDECIDSVMNKVHKCFVGTDGSVWHQNPSLHGRRQALNVMRALGGLSAYGLRHCRETPISSWLLFVTGEILELIVQCTNDKARCMGDSFITNAEELSIFIGVTILIGVYKGRGEPVRAIWSESEGRKCINQFMSRNRFELITKYLRFDFTSTRQQRRQQTKFAPMGAVYDLWEQQLSRPFIPYEYVTIDETLVPFRGRCSFKQYMPSKPAKYGLKFWCLCDAKTGYCLHMKPYLGSDNGNARAKALGQQVVIELTQRLDVGRTVVTDNFFTSLELLRRLRERNLGLVGTIRKNRRELPSEFTAKKSEAGSVLFGFNDDATLVSYSPKKNKRVLLLSSEHTTGEIDDRTGKPQIILTYNTSKGGVDHLDEMCGAYTSRKRTLRWPKCVFQHMIDVTAYNAFILWRLATNTQNANRRQFLKRIGAELCGGQVDEHGNIRLNTTRVTPTPQPATVMGVRLRCRRCIRNKTVQRCHKCCDALCINCAMYKCHEC